MMMMVLLLLKLLLLPELELLLEVLLVTKGRGGVLVAWGELQVLELRYEPLNIRRRCSCGC